VVTIGDGEGVVGVDVRGAEVGDGRAAIVARTRVCTVASTPASSPARAVACSAAAFGPPAVQAPVSSASASTTTVRGTGLIAEPIAQDMPRAGRSSEVPSPADVATGRVRS
jgi:hypothetical protein